MECACQQRSIKRFQASVECADLDDKSLIQFYCACIRSILECACQMFHSSLPQYLSDDIEMIQKRVLRIIFRDLCYNEALESARLTTPCARKELYMKLFNSIEEDFAPFCRNLIRSDTVLEHPGNTSFLISKPKDI